MMEFLTDKTFGQYDPSLTGAFLVIVRDGLVVAIEHPLGYLLPGGNVEGDETHEECLLRACLEQIAYDVRVDELITSSDTGNAHDKGAFPSVQYYYSGELLDQYAECGLGGTRLCWVDIEQLALPEQRFAVQSYMNRETSAAALSFIDGRHHILDGPLSS